MRRQAKPLLSRHQQAKAFDRTGRNSERERYHTFVSNHAGQTEYYGNKFCRIMNLLQQKNRIREKYHEQIDCYPHLIHRSIAGSDALSRYVRDKMGKKGTSLA